MFFSLEFSEIISNVAIALFIGLLIAAALNDLAVYRIPNWIVLAIVALYPIHVSVSSVSIDWIFAGVWALGAFAIGFTFFVLGAMGGGDVKLITATALWAGSEGIMQFLIITALVGGVMSIVMLTPTRHLLASAFDTIGWSRPREILLADVLPYGVAIAFGGVFIGMRMMALLERS